MTDRRSRRRGAGSRHADPGPDQDRGPAGKGLGPRLRRPRAVLDRGRVLGVPDRHRHLQPAAEPDRALGACRLPADRGVRRHLDADRAACRPSSSIGRSASPASCSASITGCSTRSSSSAPAIPTPPTSSVGVIVVLLVFEAGRRMMGPVLPIICAIFLAYGLFGQYLPSPLNTAATISTRSSTRCSSAPRASTASRSTSPPPTSSCSSCSAPSSSAPA